MAATISAFTVDVSSLTLTCSSLECRQLEKDLLELRNLQCFFQVSDRMVGISALGYLTADQFAQAHQQQPLLTLDSISAPCCSGERRRRHSGGAGSCEVTSKTGWNAQEKSKTYRSLL